MSHLPIESLGHILDMLVLPANPHQYGHSDAVQNALVQLCLTSQTFYQLTRPHLYSSVVLETASQLSLFHQTVSSSQHPPVTSIAFIGFPESLAPPHYKHLSDIIVAISSTVSRIMLDRELRELRPEFDHHGVRRQLREAIEPLKNITELASTQCELYLANTADGAVSRDDYYVCWPGWTSLQRLSLYNVVLDNAFATAIAGLPELTHLALDNPDFDVDDENRVYFPVFGGEGGRLRRVLLFEDFVRDYFNETVLANEAFRVVRPGLEIVHEQISTVMAASGLGDDFDMRTWVGQRVLDGTLWEYPGRVFTISELGPSSTT